MCLTIQHRFCALTICEMEPCIFGKCELTTTSFKVCSNNYCFVQFFFFILSFVFIVVRFFIRCYQQNNTLYICDLFLSFFHLFLNKFVNSVIVCKDTWVRRVIKSKNRAWIIHVRVEANALKKMVNGNVDVMHGGKAHVVNDV